MWGGGKEKEEMKVKKCGGTRLGKQAKVWKAACAGSKAQRHTAAAWGGSKQTQEGGKRIKHVE